MFNRWLSDSGVPPVAGYPLLLLAFIFFSVLFFSRVGYAGYIYLLFPLSLLWRLNTKKRNDFLKINFISGKYKTIRLIENLLIALPFLIFLGVYKSFAGIGILLIAVFLSAFINNRNGIDFYLPTPFKKRPYEFVIGFRKTFWIIGVVYLLAIIAVRADNFNLGIFSLIILFAIFTSYYTVPENNYYVWIYDKNPREFLLEKIKTSFIYSTVISLPLIITLSIFYVEKIQFTLLFVIAGWLFLIMLICAKYASYPDEINIVQSILMALCVIFPPLLPVMIFYFYHKAIKKLKQIL